MGIGGYYFFCSLKKNDIYADGVCSFEILTEKKYNYF